jgi:hypothetical protein
VNFVEQSCIPYLRSAQNEDGGWGFMPGAVSRVEPTAWALLALQEFISTNGAEKSAASGANFLKKSQLPDGSWAAAPGQKTGSWVSSLACWALLSNRELRATVDRGLQWISNEWPGDSSLSFRLLKMLSSGRSQTSQNDALSGWSWTPGTASWVEPTAYAMIVLRSRAGLLPAKVSQRLRTAKSMLYDRMCPGGGWNCGNPMVYVCAAGAAAGRETPKNSSEFELAGEKCPSPDQPRRPGSHQHRAANFRTDGSGGQIVAAHLRGKK